MPKVSVLIPAFRPNYLDTCLASVLGQTFPDYEILIGDDCDGEDVASVVSKWNDPRIRYARNPRRQEPGANRDFLLSRATGKYIKFLFDDDFLMPRSIELLTAAAEEFDAKLTFHGRHLVDSAGRLQYSASAVPEGRIIGVAPDFLFENLVAKMFNFVGEPSNILIDAEALRSIPNPFGLDDMQLRFLTDVGLYVNFAHRGLRMAGIGEFGSAFRTHESQSSGNSQAIYSAGLFEWDLLSRWAADQGHLSIEMARSAVSLVHQAYLPHLGHLPELSRFMALGTDPDPSGRFFGPDFRAVLEAGWEAVEQRRREKKVIAA
ncbi:MAG TPA: glycosyltransferase family 2 protein [Acidimicrobiales bacterium]|nr:glycosyltransferase family 2 protein [Acidimicrobiales bacterium]